MRRFSFGMALILLAAAVRADEAADRPVLVLQTNGHTASICKILYTPDAKCILTVSVDKTVRLWDAHSGERLGVLRPPVGPGTQGELRAGALSPDGKTLAVGGLGYEVDGKHVAPIYLIDLAGERIAARLQDERVDFVYCLAFSPDGKRLASGGGKGAAFLWDVAAGKRLFTLEEPKDAVPPADDKYPSDIHDIAFSPNGKLLAAASRDKTAWIWSAETGRKMAGPLAHEDAVLSVAWKDDDTLAAAGAGDAGIHLWDRTGKDLRRFDKLRSAPANIESLTFVHEKNKEELFYTWTRRPEDKKSNWESGGAFLNLDNPALSRDGLSWRHASAAVCGAVSPNGKEAATNSDFALNLWGVKDGKRIHSLSGAMMNPFHAFWNREGWIVAWDYPKKIAPDAPEEVAHRAFDLGGLTFPSANKYQRPLGGFHVQGDNQLERLDDHTLEVIVKTGSVKVETQSALQCYTWLWNGRQIAVGAGGQLALYDARSGRLLRQFGGHLGYVMDVAPRGRYLLASFTDQTLRVYDPGKEEPLLSLFVAEADWVAWTQEGYYAASPGGEKLMGWQVNRGLDQLAAFYPAEQFHQAFYRPDVIQRVLAEGSVEKAKALPPEVSILAPMAGKVEKEVEVKAQALSKDRPIVAMHLVMDGRPCPGVKAKTFAQTKPGDKQEASWKVTLPYGEHHLTAIAETDAGLGASPEVVVAWQSAAQEALPTLYVLAIGINAYPGSLKLEWAVDDARAVQKAFQTGGAPKPYSRVETKPLLDKDATRDGILAGLDWLKAKMTADDTAVVFYAGHGHRDRKTGQFYLLPQDVNVGDLEKTGVTGTQLKDKLKAVPGRVLVLLDACHSGSIGDSPADPESLTDDVRRQLAAPDCGVVILCAAMAQEEAGEAAAVKHGFFTAALLSGLGGEAPTDKKDGLIHLTGLDFYVEQAVAELSKEEQHVVVDRPSTVTSFPLVKPPAKAEEK